MMGRQVDERTASGGAWLFVLFFLFCFCFVCLFAVKKQTTNKQQISISSAREFQPHSNNTRVPTEGSLQAPLLLRPTFGLDSARLATNSDL
jgi:hypothetical protein